MEGRWKILIEPPGREAEIQAETPKAHKVARAVWGMLSISGLQECTDIIVTVNSIGGQEVNAQMTLARLGQVLVRTYWDSIHANDRLAPEIAQQVLAKHKTQPAESK